MCAPCASNLLEATTLPCPSLLTASLDFLEIMKALQGFEHISIMGALFKKLKKTSRRGRISQYLLGLGGAQVHSKLKYEKGLEFDIS